MDLRNVGGLRTTADHLYKHQMAILNAKPAINIKPPKIVFKFLIIRQIRKKDKKVNIKMKMI